MSTSDLRERLAAARLYLCIDARRERGDLLDVVAAAVEGGVDIVQLRDKGSVGERQFETLEAAEELDILGALGEVIRARGALLSVNDRADLARLAGADVLHVGQGDLTPAQARSIVGPDMIIGISTHDESQARAAFADGDVDYFCTGPCWSTPTKPGRAGTGLDFVRAVAALDPTTPWFAIGGIDADRLPQVTAVGARRAVVVRAITDADDPRAAAAELAAGLRQA